MQIISEMADATENSKPTFKFWSKDEVQGLMDGLGRAATDEEISAAVGRAPDAVRSKIKSLAKARVTKGDATHEAIQAVFRLTDEQMAEIVKQAAADAAARAAKKEATAEKRKREAEAEESQTLVISNEALEAVAARLQDLASAFLDAVKRGKVRVE